MYELSASSSAPEMESTEERRIDTLDFSRELAGVEVKVFGLSRLHPSSLATEFQQIKSCRSVGELLYEVHLANEKLNSLQLFKKIKVLIKLGSLPETLAVEYSLQEQRMSCIVNTVVDQRGRVSLEVNGGLPIVFRRPISLEGKASISGVSNAELMAKLEFHRFPGFFSECSGSLQLVNSLADYLQISSFTQRCSGIRARLHSLSGTHSFNWGLMLRDSFPALNERVASKTILTSQLRSLNHSLGYVFSYGNAAMLANSLSPAHLFKFSVESTLPGGTVSFAKMEAYHLFRLAMQHGMVFHAGFAGGFMFPWGNNTQLHIVDKFRFNRSCSFSKHLRGYGEGAIEPYDEGLLKATDKGGTENTKDYLGGDLFCSFQGMLSYDLRRLASPGGEVFAFAGIGSLFDSSHSGALPQRKISSLPLGLLSSFRGSLGIGVAFPLAHMGRIELSLSKPFWNRISDTLARLELKVRIWEEALQSN